VEHAGEKPVSKAPASSTVQVGGTEFHFALSTQTVRKGTVTFEFRNNGGIPHNLRINGKQTPNIDPGETTTLKVALAKAGNYPYVCTLPATAAGWDERLLKVE
jgi:plastocyanin